ASQLAAYASHQSSPLAGRDDLDAAALAVGTEFEGRDVPRPAFWGGFRVVPSVIEFWQHREDRLHDRLVFYRDGRAWRRERLAP
ncbi:MAG: pyridoxine 5'-phosphate oxidase C-terminal domain-containing protein, partial [Acidimicrobiales bacterium]